MAETPTVATTLAGICIGDAGVTRRAPQFAELGVFHRLGVTPDGSQIIFEVTDETGTIFPPGALAVEQKGIFAVRPIGETRMLLPLPQGEAKVRG